MTRNELIELCESSIVPWDKWNDRDSYVAQQNVNQCYQLLHAGAEYELKINSDTINIKFINLNKDIINHSHNFNLSIDDVYLYQEANPDTQIFEYYSNCQKEDIFFYCYLPTLEYLSNKNGEDWV